MNTNVPMDIPVYLSILLIYLGLGIAIFLINVMLLRWIFRVNKIIDTLKEISKKLDK